MKSDRVTLMLWWKHLISRLLHYYADKRIGATKAEKHCYKNTDTILLTFDDFAPPEQVRAILSVLKEKQVKAMFFLQGTWATQYPELIEMMRVDNHIIGNHTATHMILRDAVKEAIEREIIEAHIAGPWLRPPQGRYNDRVRKIAAKLGYVICYWTIDSRDWTNASVEAMKYTIMSELQPGAVVLFHLHGQNTVALLPSLIDDIRLQGYELTPFTETWIPSTS